MKNTKDDSNCSAPGCCEGVDRRRFLKAMSAGAVSLTSFAAGLPVMAGPFARPAADIQHFVPADKKLARDWVRGLFERGAPRVYRGKELDTIGMPIGGIGAGQLYLRGDGTLGVWQIFNKLHFSGYGLENYKTRTVDSPVDQGFAVTVTGTVGDKPRSMVLNREDCPGVELTAEYPIAKVRYAKEGFPVRAEVEAFSPFIPLNAKDSALPATIFQITVENTSKEPQKVGVSGWLENAVCFHTASDIQARRTTRFTNEKSRGLLVHSAEEAPPAEKKPVRPAIVLADFEGESYGNWKATGDAFGAKPASGTLANQQKVSGFEGKGLVNTFLGGDAPQGTLTSPPFKIERKYVSFLIAGGGHKETCINLFVDGKAVRTASGRDNEKLEWRSWKVDDLEGREAVIEIVDRRSDGWGHINIDQIELSDERRGGPSGPVEKLEDFGTMVLAASTEAFPAELATTFGNAQVPGGTLYDSFRRTPYFNKERLDSGAIHDAHVEIQYSASLRRKAGIAPEAATLPPGAKHTFTFVLAWHFPNAEHGNFYATRFKDAAEVAHYVLDNLERLAGDTRKWHDTYYDSTLPRWLLDRLHSTVSTLATGTCKWRANGRFWAWEGVGCCHGTCTHVWNYAHAMARLFPELERSAREMQDLGEGFHDDGMISFRGETNGQYAADGQAGGILKCWREHLMCGDDAFLRRNWPKIRKALEYLIRQDANDDGIIENAQPNTYDIDFDGPNTFVGALYLASLRAGEEMAKEVGDSEFSSRTRKLFETGSRLSSEKLWNGEYFIQIVDLKKHPQFQYADGCLADQLFGQGWAHQVGLGYVYPKQQVADALRSVWKYDWAPDVGPQNAAHKPERWFVTPGEGGLFVCTWPKSEHLNEGVRYRDEVWTGIEYQVAGHMVWEGLLEEAIVMVRAIHDRYDPLKHNPWNEIECGDHYARAMASWGVFTALSGYEHHGPMGHIAFAPRITPEEFRSAFTAADGWGTFSQKRDGAAQRQRIDVKWGKLRLRTLAFELAVGKTPAKVTVTTGGKPVETKHTGDGNRVRVELASDVTLHEGEALEVRIA